MSFDLPFADFEVLFQTFPIAWYCLAQEKWTTCPPDMKIGALERLMTFGGDVKQF